MRSQGALVLPDPSGALMGVWLVDVDRVVRRWLLPSDWGPVVALHADRTIFDVSSQGGVHRRGTLVVSCDVEAAQNMLLESHP